jgi:hypothetical protein
MRTRLRTFILPLIILGALGLVKARQSHHRPAVMRRVVADFTREFVSNLWDATSPSLSRRTS